MAKMTDRELYALVDAEFMNAMGAPDGEISLDRAKALSYYMSEKMGNEIDGQSSVVTSDVADVVDGIMPSMLRLFTTSDNLMHFEAEGPEDEDKAAQESDYVNHVFFKKNNNSFLFLYTWFFDAFTQKNGIAKAWWDESEVITTENYEGLSEIELADLLDDEELEPIERAEREGETVVDGQIVPAIVHDVTFRRVSKRGQVRYDNVPPEEYRISADSRSLDPCKARMVGQEREITRSDLLAMGFDRKIVERLPAHTLIESEETRSRRDTIDEQEDYGTRDRSQDKILVREAYIMVDYDQDGRAELMQVFTAGNEVLSAEPVRRQPFHVICPQPLPHRHFGRATAERVMDVQQVSTTLLRQVLDNLYHTNNPSHAVWEQGISENTLDDLLTTRVGSIKRFARPVGESYAPITVPFTASATFPMLEYFEKVKRDRTGINSDSEGLSPDSLKNIQTSVMAQANDVSKMKIEATARIFAETGLKSLFLHIHELLLRHQRKADVVRLRGQWVEVSPSEWRTRMDMQVNIGLGISTKENSLLHLNAIWEKQTQMAQGGGLNLTVTPRNLFNTAAEIVRNANLKSPEMFFTDPGDAQAPPPSSEQEQLQMMQQQIEQRRQELDAARRQIDQQRVEMDRERMILEHQREIMKLEEQKEQRADDLFVEMEKIRNKLTELELSTGVNVPGAAV